MKISNVLLLSRKRTLIVQIYKFSIYLIYFIGLIENNTNTNTNKKNALLSRFEKQFISYQNALPLNISSYIHKAEEILKTLFKTSNLDNLFCGYCQDTLSSALLYLAAQNVSGVADKDDKKKESTQTTSMQLDAVSFDHKTLESQLLDLFLPLCRPEEVIRTNIATEITFIHCNNKQTKKKRTTVENYKKNFKNQMLMVLTNDMKGNIPMEWLYTEQIESFKKLSAFERTIKDFFSDKTRNDTLILQYRYARTNKELLEQVMQILQLEFQRFHKDQHNNEKKKFVVLLIRIKGISSFSFIFRQFQNFFLVFYFYIKWKIVYVDYLLSTSSMSFQNDLKKPVADIVGKQEIQVYIFFYVYCNKKESLYVCVLHLKTLFSCAYRAFGRLHFPHSFDALEEKKLLRLLFENEQKSPFFEKHKYVIDTLLILAFVNVLFVIYQNGGFAKYIESKKKEVRWYSKLFEKALKSQELVEIKLPDIDSSHLLLSAVEPQLYSSLYPQMVSTAALPPFRFSARRLCVVCDNAGANTNWSGHLTNWDTPYSAKAAHEYAMDLIRNYFSWHAYTPDQQDILRNIFVSLVLLSCKKLSIAAIEVTLHYFHFIISHYAYLIFIASLSLNNLSDVNEQEMHENNPGQWLVNMTLSLWDSILLTSNFVTNVHQFLFPNSISIVLDFMYKYLPADNANLMNKVLASARKIEMQCLGLMYLNTDTFMEKEKYLIEQGFLDRETVIGRILKSYSTNQNESKERYPLFVQDLLTTIKRVERIEGNADKYKVYNSILSELYSNVSNIPISEIQILKEMVLYGCQQWYSQSSLCSAKATLLNRCLELMLLDGQVNENSKHLKKWCDHAHQNKENGLELVVKISTVKVALFHLISTMNSRNINIARLEENQTVYELLQKMSQLLITFSTVNPQYDRSLHVWFLKQLYIRKGIHWIETIFAHPMIRQHFPLFGQVDPVNVFWLLRERTLCNDTFKPFVGIYGDKRYSSVLHENIVQNSFSTDRLPVSFRIIAESLSLIHLSDYDYSHEQLQS
ncbi:hypothetical protein RFI_01103 [Reticulomyxa filosa]|uniref:Uncharacterized protein n=1 Tax=Reticulomyxa filosa TaxID=46433 RepID=X6PE60_RETFI|nr:hypothetical protein RFI_01103 [Reticulomyxa filosa]|eukprot:ETO35962.1 hypothetical protein RFI_01103 [Reticulomyxa filosa]